jgi:hypothetical protein
VQGRADLTMSLAGGVGAAGSGVVLALLGYAGLSFVAMGLVAVVLGALAIRTARRRPAPV